MMPVKAAGGGNWPGDGGKAARYQIAVRAVGLHCTDQRLRASRHAGIGQRIGHQAGRLPGKQGYPFIQRGGKIQLAIHGAARNRQDFILKASHHRHVVK